MLKFYKFLRMWWRVRSFNGFVGRFYAPDEPGMDVFNERIYAGAFQNASVMMVRVCLAGELRAKYDHDLSIDWPDFAPPPPEVRELLEEVRMHMRMQHPVYVGCYGGTGRTGTFLALLAKMDGIESPIAYVRNEYRKQAVETRPQERFIRDYVV